jgi:hypothetical protein
MRSSFYRSVAVLVTGCLTATTLFVPTTPIKAAVPLGTIKTWQDSATEALEIIVLLVNESTRAGPAIGDRYPGCKRIDEDQTVTAKVEFVHRSASGLQPGDVIVFDDTFVSVSPSSCLVPGYPMGESLSPGDCAEAYLRPAETGGRKFVPTYMKACD